MKYPGLESGDESTPPWSLLGTDLAAARESLLADHLLEPSLLRSVQLFEVERRMGRPQAAARLGPDAERLAANRTDRFLLAYARAVAAFFVEDTTAGTTALDALDRAGSHDSTLAGFVLLARSRMARFSGGQPELPLTALEHLTPIDPDAAADAHREAAAHLLMIGEVEAAREHVDRALERHRLIGDRYLEALALVLLGRIEQETGQRHRAEELYRRSEAIGLEIGSGDAAALASHYIVRSIVLGSSSAPDRVGEARARINRLITDLPEFEFSRAEFLIMRSRLNSLQLDFDAARGDIDAYEAIMGRYGNQVGLANALRERARIEVATARQRWGEPGLLNRVRPARNLIGAAAMMARSKTLYRRGGLNTAADQAEAEAALLAALVGQHSRAIPLLPAVLNSTSSGSRELVRAAGLLATGDLSAADEALNRVSSETDPTSVLETIALRLAQSELARQRVLATTDPNRKRRNQQLAAERAIDALRALRPFQTTLIDGPSRTRFAEMVDPLVDDAIDRAVDAADHLAALEANEFLRTAQLAGLMRAERTRGLPRSVVELLDQMDLVDAGLAEICMRNPLIGRLLEAERSGPSPVETARQLSAQRRTLQRNLAEATSAGFAALFDPERPDLDATLRSLPSDARVLALQFSRFSPGTITRIWRSPNGGGCDRRPLSPGTARSLRVLSTRARGPVGPDDLAPLADLVPTTLIDDLAAEATARQPPPLIIVPSGPLWGVPWAAVPVGDDSMLVALADLLLAPSLTVQALVNRRESAPTERHVAWVDPAPRFDGDRRSAAAAGYELLEDPADVRRLLGRPEAAHTNLVLASHGDRSSGLAHGLLAPDGTTYLRAGDFVAAGKAPCALIMAACSGAFVPGDHWNEPLGLASAALCSGSRLVIAAVGRLGLDEATSAFLDGLYRASRTPQPDWRTLSAHQRRYLADRGPDPLLAWAPVCTFGSTA